MAERLEVGRVEPERLVATVGADMVHVGGGHAAPCLYALAAVGMGREVAKAKALPV